MFRVSCICSWSKNSCRLVVLLFPSVSHPNKFLTHFLNLCTRSPLGCHCTWTIERLYPPQFHLVSHQTNLNKEATNAQWNQTKYHPKKVHVTALKYQHWIYVVFMQVNIPDVLWILWGEVSATPLKHLPGKRSSSLNKGFLGGPWWLFINTLWTKNWKVEGFSSWCFTNGCKIHS